MIRSRRRGSNLVETMVVMAVGGVIFTLSVKMLQQTFTSNHRAEQWLDVERSVQQLEYHLRRDLRASETADVSDPKALLLSGTGGEVRYTILEDRIERTESFSDGSRGLEAYRLPGVRATISKPSEETVVVTLGLQNDAGTAHEFLLRQEVGR